MITSVQNPIVKEILDLREPKGRKLTNLTLIDGIREIQKAMDAGVEIKKIVYAAPVVPPKGVQSIEVSTKVFEKIAYGSGIDHAIAVASIKRVSFNDLKLSANPLVVVVEAVEKPGNLGAILRTCDGAGVEAVLVGDPKTDLYNPNVIRASLGTLFTVPVASGTNEDIASFLKMKGIKTLGTFVDATDVYTKVNLKGPLAIVLGTEDEGLSSFWQKQCDVKVNIPMKGKADSLNVSVSAAVVIYEALRQRS